jgi:hypothetical protein
MREKKVLRRTALTPNRWSGVRVLETAHRLNARCFALLAETARVQSAGIECNAVYAPQELWAQVDARVCERAGRCPVLLLDLNFERVDWDRIRPSDSVIPRARGLHALFTVEQAAPLLREILMEAWSLARSMPSAASLLFGMAPPITKTIASLSVPEVDQLVVDYAGSLRPRWEESRPFWKHLLEAGIGTSDEALANIHLHCLQLVGTELLQSNG